MNPSKTGSIGTTWKIFALLPIVICIGCGWQYKVAFESPSKHYRLEVYQPPVLQEANLRLDLVTAGKERKTIYRVGHERYMEFAHAYWSPDESVVGFFACGTGPIQFAYDVRRQATIPYQDISAQLRDNILRDYPQIDQSRERARALKPTWSPCLFGSFMREYEKRHPSGSTY